MLGLYNASNAAFVDIKGLRACHHNPEPLTYVTNLNANKNQ